MEENALKNYRKVKVACEIETAELYLQYPYHVPDDYTFPTGFLENYNGIYSHNVPVILSQQIDTSASLLLEKK